MSARNSKSDKLMEKAAELYATNPGMSVKESMVRAGYSPNTAHNSHKLVRQDRWQRLMDKYWPDKLLADKTKELITARRKVRKFQKGDLVEEYDEIDAFAINAGLTHAFKLKNKYPSEKMQVEHKFPVPLLDVSSHQVIEIPQEAPSSDKDTLQHQSNDTPQGS